MISIYYQVKPKSAPRPRVTMRGTYNNKDYTDWKNGLRMLAKTRVNEPISGPVAIKIEFLFKAPKSWPKKRRESTEFHTHKPDIDNLIKSVLDALNCVAYKDDSQVCMIQATKQYASFDGVKIEIFWNKLMDV